MILAVLAASLILAGWRLRSRELAGLAAISLLVSVTAAATFARIPIQGDAVAGPGRLFSDLPLIFVMFMAALLAWLAVICVTVAAAARLISARRAPEGKPRTGPRLVVLTGHQVAALAVVMTALLLLGARTVAHYRGSGTDSLRVSTALTAIERSAPGNTMIKVSVSSASRAGVYPVGLGLRWALTGDGYHFPTERSSRTRTITQVTVVIRGPQMIVRITRKTCRPAAGTPSVRHRLCGPDHRPRRPRSRESARQTSGFIHIHEDRPH